MSRLSVVCICGLFVVVGCVSVAPGATSPTLAPSSALVSSPTADSTTGVTSEPSAPGPATAPATAPTPGVAKTPKPRRSPRTQEPTVTPTATAVDGINLVALSFSVHEEHLSAGEYYTATVKVLNNGSEAVDVIRIDTGYQSTSGESGATGATDIPAGLEPGATLAAQLEIFTGAGGEYTFTARVDPFNEISEINEDDNSATFQATVVEQPDLAFGADGVKASLVGGTLEVTVNLINAGSAAAPPPWIVGLSWVDDAGNSGEFGPLLVNQTLDPDEAYAPSGQFTVEPGHAYTVHALLDVSDEIDELDESNNEATATTE
jgi:hypothetical protein